jgi:hypothetical protein
MSFRLSISWHIKGSAGVAVTSHRTFGLQMCNVARRSMEFSIISADRAFHEQIVIAFHFHKGLSKEQRSRLNE